MGWNPTFTQLMVCGFFSDVVLFSNVHFCTVLKMHFVVKEKKSWAHWPISYSCFLFHQNNDSLYVNTHISMNSHPDSGGHPGNNLSLDFQKTGATTLRPPAPLHTPLLVPNYCKCPFGLAKVSNNVDHSSTVSFGGDIRFELGWDFLLSWRVSFSLESDHPIPFFFYSYSSFEYCLRFLGLNA